MPNIDATRVGAWVDYPMTGARPAARDERRLVAAHLPARHGRRCPRRRSATSTTCTCGNYRDQLLDYYIEATDSRGNVTRSEIQSVYVGAGKYTADAAASYVEDINGTVQGIYPFLVVDTTAPSAPTGLAAATVTDRSVKLTWGAASDNVGVTGYIVFRDGTQVGTSTATSYTDSGLTASTAYSYTVKARTRRATPPRASATLNVTTQAPDTTAPSAPTGLVASAVTSSSATLSWTASTDNYGVAGYYVYRNGTQIAAPTATSYTDSSLSPSTTYSYTVKAADAAGNLSAASAALGVTTGAGNTSTVYYKKGFTTPYLHYRPAGGTWTTAPGVAMPDCGGRGLCQVHGEPGRRHPAGVRLQQRQRHLGQQQRLQLLLPHGHLHLQRGHHHLGRPGGRLDGPVRAYQPHLAVEDLQLRVALVDGVHG